MPFKELGRPLVSLRTLMKGTKKCKLLRLQIRRLEKMSLLNSGLLCVSRATLWLVGGWQGVPFVGLLKAALAFRLQGKKQG